MNGKIHRLRRILSDDGRAVVFAMDHAAAFGAEAGLERPGEVLRHVQAGGADAVLTTWGVADRFAAQIGPMGLILRVDGGATRLGAPGAPLHLLYRVEDALRIGADAVVCMAFPGAPSESHTLPYLAELVGQAAAWNVPVMAEALPGGFENPAEMWTAENLAHACRIGAELGADLIKTAYPGNPDAFAAVAQVYAPVLVLGGGRGRSARDLLGDVHAAICAGAAGVVIGRAIYRHPQPDRLTAALVAVVHGGETVEAALAYLGEGDRGDV